MSNRPESRAFTLIELLIVVAIIGILAAIAIPNFLQAQTRAKVARAEADMASIGTALPCYYVDNNQYPDALVSGYLEKLIPLTTPVAYMTSIPGSAFAAWTPWMADATKVYYYQTQAACNWMEDQGWGTNIWLQYDPTDRYEWYLSAVGPDGDYDQPWSSTPGCNCLRYDPTNGVLSDGDVIRLGT